MTSIYSLLYVSKTSFEWNDQDIKTLLQASSSNNKQKGITGMLMFSGDYFIQLLEGEEQNVKQLYKHILNDQRHCEQRIIVTFTFTKRYFKEWSMGYQKISSDDLKAHSSYQEVELMIDDSKFSNSGNPALMLMKKFYDNNINP